MKLVDNAREAWRWFSVQIAALMAVLPFAWMELPADVKAYVPTEWRPWIVSGLAVAVIVGRLVAQPKAGVK
jgi:hypothetical protein